MYDSDACVLFLDSTESNSSGLVRSYLVDVIYGDTHNTSDTTVLPGNVLASAAIVPLKTTLLDCLSVHSKMRCACASDACWDIYTYYKNVSYSSIDSNVSMGQVFF